MFFFVKKDCTSIAETFNQIASSESNEARDEGLEGTYQQEVQEQKKEISKRYGWIFLAKEVAEFSNCSLFQIMDTPALEVAGLVSVIQAKIELMKLEKNRM